MQKKIRELDRNSLRKWQNINGRGERGMPRFDSITNLGYQRSGKANQQISKSWCTKYL